MADPTASAKRFLFKILLWLPVSFAVWYLFAAALTWPLASLTNAVFTTFFSNAVDAVQQQAHVLIVEAHYNLATLFGLDQPHARLERRVSFTVNALQYTYSLPLFVGMALATPGRLDQKLKRCVIGGLVLVPVALGGVCAEILYQLASRPGPIFNIGSASTVQQIYTGVPRPFLAFAYQFGLVILPAVTPALVWAALHRGYLQQLTLNIIPHKETRVKPNKKMPQNGK